jgi:2',3'-cyclic-nucleotide 2'-phosphodiesterase (5'-nucleotidase family)
MNEVKMFFYNFKHIWSMKFSTYIIYALLILLSACKARYFVNNTQFNAFAVHDTVSITYGSPIQKFLLPFHDSLAKTMREIIGEANADFVKKKPNGSLGNLIVDAMYLKAIALDSNVFGAITNYGGIRIAEIKKGNITTGKMYELLPFENELVIIEVSGVDLIKWMNLIAENGGWPVQFKVPLHFRNNSFIASWFDAETNFSMPFNTLKTSAVYHVDEKNIYKIATNDYVANGGDNCDFLKNCKRQSTGILLRNIVIQQIKKLRKIEPNKLLGKSNPIYNAHYTDVGERLKFEK